jgi:hypothetical protein
MDNGLTIRVEAKPTSETQAEREEYAHTAAYYLMLVGAARLPPPARVPYPIWE